MRRLRTIGVLLVFLVATGLAFGNFAAAEIDSQRGANAEVASNDGAYLGFEQRTTTVTSGVETTVAVYTNQFLNPLDELTVVHADSGEVVAEIGPDGPALEPGESTPVSATVTCNATERIELVFLSDASGSGSGVSVRDTATVQCES